MTRNRPGGNDYQYGNNEYDQGQSYGGNQQYDGQYNSSNQSGGYNDLPPYPQQAGGPQYGDSQYGESNRIPSYDAPNQQPYQSYPPQEPLAASYYNSHPSQPYSRPDPPPPQSYGQQEYSQSSQGYNNNNYQGGYNNQGYQQQSSPMYGTDYPLPSNPDAPGAAGEDDRGIMGALAGGAAGAYGGHKVHHGVLGTVGGAIAGSMAENAYKKHEKKKSEERLHQQQQEQMMHQQQQMQMYQQRPAGGDGPRELRGNFHASSNNIRLNKTVLKAECADTHGHHRTSEIDLNDCLTNTNGRLNWQRGGNFAASTKDMYLSPDGRVLEAELGDGVGGWVWNRIWLDERIGNENGRLHFVD